MKKPTKKERLQSGFSRRQFISMMGMAGAFFPTRGPLEILGSSLVDGLIGQAQAAEGMTAPRNYLVIAFPGAPTRWVWDSFLRPNGNDDFIRNNSVNNWITDNTYSGDNSKTAFRADPIALANGKTVYGPPIWNSPIPVHGGGTVPMSTLLNHTMLIRGVNMLVDVGHATGPARLMRPLMSAPSINGLVADASSAPLSAVSISPYGYSSNLAEPKYGGFKARHSGITLVRGVDSSVLNRIIGPFQDSNTSVLAEKTKREFMAAFIEQAMAELGAYARSSKPGADTLYRNRDKAEALLKRGFGDLSAQYAAISKRYNDLAKAVSIMPVTGIIPATGSGSYNLGTGSGNVLASQFAVAEFLLVNGLSSAINISTNNSFGFAGLSNYNDEHDQPDRQRSLICHSAQFRLLATLVNEFKRAIGPSLWNETVVQIGAEYDRYPNDDMQGTDHAAGSNIFTLMSGAITEHISFGNIRVGSTVGSRKGTWGQSAPVQSSFGSFPLNKEHAAAAIAALLRVESPVRVPSLISVSSGRIQLLAEGPKNVA